MGTIALNARFQVHRPTGMQRYAIEVSGRFPSHLDPVRPDRNLRGAAGHLWEQLCLPLAVKGRLLWSPNNTGPLAVKRHVCTIHDLIPLEHPEWFNSRFAGWYRWLMPRLAARVSHVIAVSQFTGQRVSELLGVGADRITVIPNGVDPRFSPRPAAEVGRVCEALGIRPREYILSVGSVEPRKNLGRLLSAWRRIHSNVPSGIDLVIAGSRGSGNVFRSVQLEALPPRVRFTGYVCDEQLPALYSGARVFVYPSLYEGFGLPPLEAMACGTPVVASKGTSLDEVTAGAAITVDPMSPASIGDGILTALGSPSLLDSLRRSGLKRARPMTWDRTARETLRLLLAL